MKKDKRVRIFQNIEKTIGSTPLVRLNSIGKDLDVELIVKLEFFNPLGSVKDRIAASMIRSAEDNRLIDSETLIVEPTSGNTGISLAFICALKGYDICLVMPDSMSIERRRLLAHLWVRILSLLQASME